VYRSILICRADRHARLNRTLEVYLERLHRYVIFYRTYDIILYLTHYGILYNIFLYHLPSTSYRRTLYICISYIYIITKVYYIYYYSNSIIYYHDRTAPYLPSRFVSSKRVYRFRKSAIQKCQYCILIYTNIL